jgi:hypothetical protein
MYKRRDEPPYQVVIFCMETRPTVPRTGFSRYEVAADMVHDMWVAQCRAEGLHIKEWTRPWDD